MRYFVIPVKTGIQSFQYLGKFWIPACAGMTTFYEFIKIRIKKMNFPSLDEERGRVGAMFSRFTQRKIMSGSKIMGGILLALGVFVGYQGIELSLGTPSRPGAGFVPFGLGAILVILAAFYLWQNRTYKEKEKGVSPGGNYRRTAMAVGVLCFFALMVTQAGYILTTFFSFILWLSLIERKSWLQTASLACLAVAAVYAFNVLFSVQLPAGLLKGILR